MGTRIEQTDLARDALYTKVNQIASEKQDTLTFDSTPTANSTNPVTSGGVKSALDNKADDDAVVKLTGDQNVAGNKNFSGTTTVVTPSVSSNTNVPATTAYVNAKFQVVNSLPANPDADTFYFIKE